jgi:hypothetical protein
VHHQDLGEISPRNAGRACRNGSLVLLNHGFTSCYSLACAKLRLDGVARQEIEEGHLADASNCLLP